MGRGCQTTTVEMIAIVLFLASILIIPQVVGISCYLCSTASGGEDHQEDSCLGFNSSTPTCDLSDGRQCYEAFDQHDEIKVSSYGCDVSLIPHQGLCAGNENRCRKEEFGTICCCGGDRCNSDSSLSTKLTPFEGPSCYDCRSLSSGVDTEDTCGGFTNSTPTCFPAADGGK